MARYLKFSGMPHPDDERLAAVLDQAHVIAPQSIPVVDKATGQTRYVQKYGPTVANNGPTVYAPATDVAGNYMSYKFQPNNNCYNYSCDIATNSFAQPGRQNGIFLDFPPTGSAVVAGAVADGLVDLGAGYPSAYLNASNGHPVALLISAGDTALGWPGDYHWVRYDQKTGAWSQKDGGDQVTNFDFAGQPIADPATSNWTVNQGSTPQSSGGDVVADYVFYTYMFVTLGSVAIL
ncbi:hypothetical protein [Stappia sp.]|jgi:hypothetical protein|uniref:hypothetical protein n=1 Tax=Stappia sp. TaxID=1870903 RepID=UPI003A999BA9